MSAQQRYLTLVQHISKIYSAKDGGIDELTVGLKDILTRVNPAMASDWKKVQTDSKRLLRVWHSRADDDDATADEVVDQIAESLKEFSVGEIEVVPVIEKPILVVSEVSVAPFLKTVTLTVEDEEEEEEEEEDEEEEEEEDHVVVVVKKGAEPVLIPHNDSKMLVDDRVNLEVVSSSGPMEMDDDDEDEDEDEDEEDAEANSEELEEDADVAESIVEEAKIAEETNKAAEEEEVIEPVDDEEVEEEGMEVEKRIIRGRPYWIDINTNKLYAVIGDDDVGDEVGAIINGKSVFRA